MGERRQIRIGMPDRIVKFMAATTIHSDGRTQIPFPIRQQLGLADGAHLFWYELDGRYFISPTPIDDSSATGKTYFSKPT